MKYFVLFFSFLTFSFSSYAKPDEEADKKHMKSHREQMQIKRKKMKQDKEDMKANVNNENSSQIKSNTDELEPTESN